MLVVVNQPHINHFKIEGTISPSFMNTLKKEFGDAMMIESDECNSDEWIIAEDTTWYKTQKESRTPAVNLNFYRTQKRLTQKELGQMLGIEKQYVSDMEHGRKEISKAMAKKLSEIFNVSVSKFI